MKLKRFFIVAFFALLLPFAGHAASIIEMINAVPGMENCATTGPKATPIAGTDTSALTCNSLDTILVVFAVAAQWLLGITGSVVLLMFVWGGAQWIFSAGSSKMIEAGKKKMTGAVIGMALVFGALAIVRTIRVGLKVTTVQCVIDADCKPTTGCASDPSQCNVCSAGICKPAGSVNSGGGTIRTPGGDECTTQKECTDRLGSGYDCSTAHKCVRITAPTTDQCTSSSQCTNRGNKWFCKSVSGVKQCVEARSCADYPTQTDCVAGYSNIEVQNGRCQWVAQSAGSAGFCTEVHPQAGTNGNPCPATGCGPGLTCVTVGTSTLNSPNCTDGKVGSKCNDLSSRGESGCLTQYGYICDSSTWTCKSSGTQTLGQACLNNADCADGACSENRCFKACEGDGVCRHDQASCPADKQTFATHNVPTCTASGADWVCCH